MAKVNKSKKTPKLAPRKAPKKVAKGSSAIQKKTASPIRRGMNIVLKRCR